MLALIALTGLLRIALAGAVGLSVDESYTVAISRQLALSYYDHPPLHVWLVGLWARLLATESPLLLRLPDIALFAGSTWLLYRLTAGAYGERAAWWAAVALNLAPLYTLNAAGGLVPDGPLVFFALLAVLAFRAGWMLTAGAAAGLALLSKYTATFPILSLGLYLATSRPRALAQAAPWLALALVLALFVPVLMWNDAHGWASFAFQGGRALPAQFSPARALASFAAQLLYLLPWTGAAALFALWRALRRGPGETPDWLFAMLAAPPIAFFSLAALWTRALPHWSAIGWLFALPPLGAFLVALERRRPRIVPAVGALSAVLLCVVVTLFVLQARTGLLDRVLPGLAAHDPTLDVIDWRELDPVVTALARSRPDLVIATVSWIDAGKTDYALGGAVPVLCLSQDPRGFRYLHDPRAFAGHDALIVADSARPDWLRLAAPYFRRVTPTGDVHITRAGVPALTLHTAWGAGLVPRTASPHLASERPTLR